jgi:hypothetical protein
VHPCAAHALQHRTMPPCQGGLRGCHVSSGSESCLPDRKGSSAAMCTVARNPATLQGRAPVRHVSCSSGFYLSAGEGSRVLHVLRFQILPPY